MRILMIFLSRMFQMNWMIILRILENAIDVDYTKVGYCNFCNTRIDEFGYCACIGGQPG